MVCHLETTNRIELLFFTSQQQVYKTRASEFQEVKASVMGDYVPAKLGFGDGEYVVQMIATMDYSGDLLFVFANGKLPVCHCPLMRQRQTARSCKMRTATSHHWYRCCKFRQRMPHVMYLCGQMAIVQCCWMPA